ncbi:MAG: pyridoxal-phosphate dependent enzyme, partial [Clostridiales bacterium]|nr:pyridoxal-phosphate dependent enzyme [Candidatus Blautia equi]
MSIIEALKMREETLWLNPEKRDIALREKIDGYGFVYVKAAQNRFMRFLPYLAKVFPETAAKKGVIESVIYELPEMKKYLNENGANLKGRLLLKDDAHLPIAGSVKARGGIHEVLKIAEQLTQKAKLLTPADNYEAMDGPEFRELFSQYTIQVGSTGNLGISIGRTAARMGFKVIVHMSCDAKDWKK